MNPLGQPLLQNLRCPAEGCGWAVEVTTLTLARRYWIQRHQCSRKKCGAHFLAGYYSCLDNPRSPRIDIVGVVLAAGRNLRSWEVGIRQLKDMTAGHADPMTDDDLDWLLFIASVQATPDRVGEGAGPGADGPTPKRHEGGSFTPPSTAPSAPDTAARLARRRRRLVVPPPGRAGLVPPSTTGGQAIRPNRRPPL